MTTPTSVAPPARRSFLSHPPAWLASVLLFAVLLGVYLANRRELGIGDTVPNTLMPLAMIRGDGIYLDRFFKTEESLKRCWWVTKKNDRVVSRYPIGPAVLALPIAWACVTTWDLLFPGWDATVDKACDGCTNYSKHAASIISALAMVVLYRLLRIMDVSQGIAWVAALATGLGSEVWAVASQAMWQHGPAMLALMTALWLLAPPRVTRGHLLFAGLAVAALVCFRANNLVFAGAIFLAVAWQHRWRTIWFLPFPVVLAGLLVAYNLHFFGALDGGQTELEQMHVFLHAQTQPSWSGNLVSGAAGTLLSPSRGLFIYCPWVVVSLALLPVTYQRLKPFPVVTATVIALVPFVVMLSKYITWWAGCCYGPRYWTEVMPLFGILLALALEWAWNQSRAALGLLAATILLGVAFQVVGAFIYPSTWFGLDHAGKKSNVDHEHHRLWDWRDTEFRRCLEDGP